MNNVHLLPATCESGNVYRERIGFYGEPNHSWMWPRWTPDRGISIEAYKLLESTFPQWAQEMIRETVKP